MICALTVRTLEPGTFDEFREAFMAPMASGEPPEGWVRFTMVRNAADPDEVVCFGFFDGSVEDLQGGDRSEYDAQQAAIAPFVASVGADGLYEVVESLDTAAA